MFPLKDTIQSSTFPFINWLLIAINVLVFLGEASMPTETLEAFLGLYGVVPARLVGEFNLGQGATIFSSMFLHSGWAHLLGNMWLLYIFGDNVEDRMGHLKYLCFYLLVGVVAAVVQMETNLHSLVPMVGASGAISGVLGAYLAYFPKATVISLVPLGFYARLIEVPAVVFLGLWFVMEFFSGFASLVGARADDIGGVAFWAHVGGFGSGLVAAKLFAGPARELHSDEVRPW